MSCENYNYNLAFKNATSNALYSYYTDLNNFHTKYPGITGDISTVYYKPIDNNNVFSDGFKNEYSNVINTDLNNIDPTLANLYIEDGSNIYANCVLQSGSKWFTTKMLDQHKSICGVVDDIDFKNKLINKDNVYYTNFIGKNKDKPGKSLFCSNINKAYCENRWYDWIITPNYHLGNTYYKDIGKYTQFDVNKCYKPCDGDSLPFITEKNEYKCIPKKYYQNGIFANKYMFSPIGLINLIGNYAATLDPGKNIPDKNPLNDYNFTLYRLVLQYNLKNNIDTNTFEIITNISNLAVNYNNVFDNFSNIYNEFKNCIDENILNNFNKTDNQVYSLSTNFTYKSPLFNENEPDMYTLKGLNTNNLLIDPILIHTWLLANTFTPYPNDDDISDLKTSGLVPININKNQTRGLLFDCLFNKTYNEEDKDDVENNKYIKQLLANRLKNIFFKAVNICYDKNTNFGKNIIELTKKALTNSDLKNHIYTHKMYLPQKGTVTGTTNVLQNNNIGFQNISNLQQLLEQSSVDNFKLFKYYDVDLISNINKKYSLLDITNPIITPQQLEFNKYLFAYEDLETKIKCSNGEIFDNNEKKCVKRDPSKETKIDNDIDDVYKIPNLKKIFSQFLKIIIAIIIIVVIYFLIHIAYEPLMKFINMLYIYLIEFYLAINLYWNKDNKEKDEYEFTKYKLENLDKNISLLESDIEFRKQANS